MSKKDPAFLFYSKDWIEGTADLMPDEKGVYIDLLAHQHQKGFLPTDEKRLARMVGLSEIEFTKIWSCLSHKFPIDGDVLKNGKLQIVIDERKTKAHQNKILGKFSSLLKLSELSKSIKDRIRKEFNLSTFLNESSETVNETLTRWFTARSASLVNGDANANEDVFIFPKEYLQNKIEIDLEQLNAKSGLSIDDFDFCLTQWSLKVIEKGWEYSGDDSKDLQRLRAGFEKWLGTWLQTLKKESSNGKQTPLTKVQKIITSNQELHKWADETFKNE